ncbi:hypothetical protein CEXT_320031 [Caerostris extrusa]|uniref:Uncharacterized protein n=1 Tax=Caerostris extrusa TaxID=172846 RepID=A0AAV4YCV3_CAEEX|nr:hypothetical protein CEXT_320031 [Caerostris extrusa]
MPLYEESDDICRLPVGFRAKAFFPTYIKQLIVETAAAETFSQHAVTNRNLYNPETSDFLFPDWPHGQDRQSESTHLQPPSETNYLITNQYPQCSEDLNTEHSANAPMPVAEPFFFAWVSTNVWSKTCTDASNDSSS